MFAGQACQIFGSDFAAFSQLHRTTIGFLTNNHTLNTVECVIIENTQLIAQILTVTFQFRINNGLSTFVALNTFTSKELEQSITVPLMPVGIRNEVSFTSDAFSPKMARSSFSSGVSWFHL